jgi:hypothetical protein
VGRALGHVFRVLPQVLQLEHRGAGTGTYRATVQLSPVRSCSVLTTHAIVSIKRDKEALGLFNVPSVVARTDVSLPGWKLAECLQI